MFLPRHRHGALAGQAELHHHRHAVRQAPMFDGLAVDEADDVEAFDVEMISRLNM
jgi:hypothetical protein